jgi:NADPH-dependent glutamate synthase beta subunit-like oxidoreductase
MKMSPGGIDESGRRKPVPTDKTELLLCDTIISAVGEKVSSGIIAECGLETRKNGTVVADSFTFRTARKKVYAIGDIVSGPATAAEAMGMALRASRAIDRELSGKAAYDEARFESLFGNFTYSDEVPDEPVGDAMRRAPMIPVSERRRNFVELSLGYSGKQAMEEAERCLRCDVGTARRAQQYRNREEKRVVAGRS